MGTLLTVARPMGANLRPRTTAMRWSGETAYEASAARVEARSPETLANGVKVAIRHVGHEPSGPPRPGLGGSRTPGKQQADLPRDRMGCRVTGPGPGYSVDRWESACLSTRARSEAERVRDPADHGD